MTPTDTPTPGCLIEGGLYIIEEGNQRLIEIAQEYGFVPEASDDELEDSETREFEAEAADRFLNDTFKDLWFGWVDGDYMCEELSNVEDEL